MSLEFDIETPGRRGPLETAISLCDEAQMRLCEAMGLYYQESNEELANFGIGEAEALAKKAYVDALAAVFENDMTHNEKLLYITAIDKRIRSRRAMYLNSVFPHISLNEDPPIEEELAADIADFFEEPEGWYLLSFFERIIEYYYDAIDYDIGRIIENRSQVGEVTIEPQDKKQKAPQLQRLITLSIGAIITGSLIVKKIRNRG